MSSVTGTFEGILKDVKVTAKIEGVEQVTALCKSYREYFSGPNNSVEVIYNKHNRYKPILIMDQTANYEIRIHKEAAEALRDVLICILNEEPK